MQHCERKRVNARRRTVRRDMRRLELTHRGTLCVSEPSLVGGGVEGTIQWPNKVLPPDPVLAMGIKGRGLEGALRTRLRTATNRLWRKHAQARAAPPCLCNETQWGPEGTNWCQQPPKTARHASARHSPQRRRALRTLTLDTPARLRITTSTNTRCPRMSVFPHHTDSACGPPPCPTFVRVSLTLTPVPHTSRHGF